MKAKITKTILLLCLPFFFLPSSCKKEEVPVVSTSAVTIITQESGTSGGTVISEGTGTVIGRGVCWSTGVTPSISDSKTADGSGPGSFVSLLSGITPNTKYYIRAYSTNQYGTGYGNEMSFTTLGQLPASSTQAAKDITNVSAQLNGTVNPNYLSTVVTFEYGTTTNYGSIATASQSPVTGSSSISISAGITGLLQGTTYHFRTKAVNELGTKTGDDMTFITLTSLSDIEGNIYFGVTIGTQVWMTENLKTTILNDGTTPIPNVTDASSWVNLTTPGYCWYGNNIANKDVYGALYNWQTINTGKLCPTGWHVPTDDEWTKFNSYLITNGFNYDGTTYGGKVAKSITLASVWQSSTVIGSVGNADYPAKRNATGFSGLPGGLRNFFDGAFSNFSISERWWSSTESGTTNAWGRSIRYDNSEISIVSYPRNDGYSVRCLKD